MSAMVPVDQIQTISKSITPSLFSLKNEQEVFTLMMLGQADGIHPITALRRYHIVNGKPSMKADAMLACFLESGGRVQWIERTDRKVKAVFHKGEDSVTVEWTIERANAAKITGKDVWKSYPCQMLTARVISEGIRLIMPQIVSGLYTPEEVQDFTPAPVKQVQQVNQETWGNNEEAPPFFENPEPPAPSMTPEEIAEKKKNLTAWIMDMLNPETFQRNDDTTTFATFKKQIIEDGAGLPDDVVIGLRKDAWFNWHCCMIATSPPEELASLKWDNAISESKLDQTSQEALKRILISQRKAISTQGAAA